MAIILATFGVKFMNIEELIILEFQNIMFWVNLW
jgi:hypothetical protein